MQIKGEPRHAQRNKFTPWQIINEMEEPALKSRNLVIPAIFISTFFSAFISLRLRDTTKTSEADGQ